METSSKALKETCVFVKTTANETKAPKKIAEHPPFATLSSPLAVGNKQYILKPQTEEQCRIYASQVLIPVSAPDVLNSVGEPTYRPSSKKGYISEINQPPSGDLDASPSKTATQHSQTSDSDHETDSIEEGETGGNPEPMVVDELAEDKDAPGDDLHKAGETNNPHGEGGDVEDTVVEEESEGNPTIIPDDDEGFEGGRLMHAKSKLKLKLLSLQLWQMFQRPKFRRVVLGVSL